MSTLSTYLPLFSGRGRVITHVSGWLMVFVMFFYLISGVRGNGEALARASVNVGFMLVIFYGNAKLIVNRYVEKRQIGDWIWLVVAFWLAATLLRTAVELYIFRSSVFNVDIASTQGTWRLLVGYGLSFMMLLVFSTLYQLAENRHALEVQHLELEAKHQEAQLNYLKAQINPHFLFNTLNNIYAAASLQHPRTPDMVLRLSDLLRYVTYDAQAAQVPLDKELAQVRAYIELFQLKSEAALPITVEVSGDTAPHRIPPMLLLPMVENALKHGDLEHNPQGFVRFILQAQPGRLHVIVENSYNPDNVQKDTVGGVGLPNIRQRLALHYPGRHTLQAVTHGQVYAIALDIF